MFCCILKDWHLITRQHGEDYAVFVVTANLLCHTRQPVANTDDDWPDVCYFSTWLDMHLTKLVSSNAILI